MTAGRPAGRAVTARDLEAATRTCGDPLALAVREADQRAYGDPPAVLSRVDLLGDRHQAPVVGYEPLEDGPKLRGRTGEPGEIADHQTVGLAVKDPPERVFQTGPGEAVALRRLPFADYLQ